MTMEITIDHGLWDTEVDLEIRIKKSFDKRQLALDPHPMLELANYVVGICMAAGEDYHRILAELVRSSQSDALPPVLSQTAMRAMAFFLFLAAAEAARRNAVLPTAVAREK